MRNIFLLMIAALSMVASGCAYKGKLLTPTEMAQKEKKKQLEAEKEQRRAAQPAAETPAPEAK